MEGLILKTLTKIRKETPRRLKELRVICDELILQLQSKEKTNNNNINNNINIDTDADKYFEPLKMACESRVSKVMEIALDAIHILIERGYLRGTKKITINNNTATTNNNNNNIKDEEKENEENEIKSKNLILMDLIIDTISKCSDEFDDSVQLQVINCLLTAVTSPYCEVHEASLLLSVRACFHIHLITRNNVNKTTAKAALTQILSSVFRRMEMLDSSSRAFRANTSAIGGGYVLNNNNNNNSNSNNNNDNGDNNDDSLSYNQSMYAEVYDSLGFRSSTNGSMSLPLLDQSEVSVVTSNNNIINNKDTTDSSDNNNSNDNNNNNNNNNVGEILEKNKSETTILSFPSIHHKDAFLLFRALCKLSMKGLHDDSGTMNDPIALQNKLLSLELILHVLQKCGPAFKTGDRFIYSVRNYLCVSLLGNCTSQVADVTFLALHIFVLVMANFKDHLKAELEIFINNIFLRILESEYSSYDLKMKVLEVLQNIVQDPALQIEIFVNYDCDFEANDMFRRIVDAFAKISKNPNLPSSRSGTDFLTSSIKKTELEVKNIKASGLEGLVIIIRSLLRSSGLGLPPAVSDVLSNNVNIINVYNTHSNTTNNNNNNNIGLNSKSPKRSSVAYGSNSNMMNMDDENDDNIKEDEQTTQSMVPVANYDRKQKLIEEIDTGILKFNLNPKRGIQYLISKGHIENNPKDVAKFFHTYKIRLDKTQVGEYLGKEREYENGFCLKVLHEYVDMMDFNQLRFDEAIRYFLSGFRIPGEAQKIDRIMEKFAERYYLQNRDVFASADMAFILAFSTIMLQTNLHNPAIKDEKRMTKEQFLKQNKGISSDGELPESLLSDIYDNIAARPISLTSDDNSTAASAKKNKNNKKEDTNAPFAVFNNDKRRKDAYHNERKEMVKAGEAMIKQNRKKLGRQGSVYVRTGTIDNKSFNNTDNNLLFFNNGSDEVYVKPMFEVSWAPMLGVFSQIFETSDDNDLISLCLTGFLYAIRLSSRTPEFVTARQSFINALARFTTLETVKEMKIKNIEAIRALLYVALCDAEYLDESWSQILHCISQLYRLILIGNGLHDDGEFMNADLPVPQQSTSLFNFSNSPLPNITNTAFRRNTILSKAANVGNLSNSTNNPLDPFKIFSNGPTKAETARNVEENNALLIINAEHIDDKVIDRIIVNSQYLSSESVIHFIESLCEVSRYEITNDNRTVLAKESAESYSPRVFALQKLVEVADYNMHVRHRVDWARMWSSLANYFCTVGVNDNFNIAMYAIDSLRQLSIKFLQKEELSNFNFQRLFLKPFEVIMTKSKSNDIRDIVLNCLDVMIRACASNIRSGWRTIFTIFEVAAGSENPNIAKFAYSITDRLLTQQFDLLIYDFVEIMNCLVAFVASSHTSLSLAALNHLAACAKHLVDGDIPIDTVTSTKEIVTNRKRGDSSININIPSTPKNLIQTLSTSSPSINSIKKVFDNNNNNNNSIDITRSPSNNNNNNNNEINIITEDASVFRLWWPLLLGLAARIADSRFEVRSRALDTLVGILSDYGHYFSAQAWCVIFKGVLFPIMDSATTDFTPQPESRYPRQFTGPNASKDKDSWIGTTGLKVIIAIINLFDQFKFHIFYDLTAKNPISLLSDIITLLESCINQDIESLARLGLFGLRYLMKILLPNMKSSSNNNNNNNNNFINENSISITLISSKQYLNNYNNKDNTLFYRECCNILCYRISNITLKNLCLNYRDAGKLISISIPRNDNLTDEMKIVMNQCPITIRHAGSNISPNINPNNSLISLYSEHINEYNTLPMNINSFENGDSDEEENNSEDDILVETPYGKGKLHKTLKEIKELNIPERKEIILTGWGGKLYCNIENYNTYETAAIPSNSLTSSSSLLSLTNKSKLLESISLNSVSLAVPAISWRKLSSAAMVSMVVTLDLIDMIGELLHHNFDQWQIKHYEILLYTLIVVHYHAKEFNKNKEIRMQLKLRHFMEFTDRIDRLPHLLDQEVASMEQILLLILRLYRNESDTILTTNYNINDHNTVKNNIIETYQMKKSFIEVYVQRYCPYVIHLYCQYDTLLLSNNSLSSTYTVDASFFIAEQLDAYTSSLNIVMLSICDTFPLQTLFLTNIEWIVPMLSQLNLCTNRMVRKLVYNINEKLLNPYILQCALADRIKQN